MSVSDRIGLATINYERSSIHSMAKGGVRSQSNPGPPTTCRLGGRGPPTGELHDAAFTPLYRCAELLQPADRGW